MRVRDPDYFRQRAEEELAAAEQASDPSISQIHRDMARRYSEMLKSGTPAVDIAEVRTSLKGLSPA